MKGRAAMGTKCVMSCDCVAVALVQTVKSTISQSNFSKISVEPDSHADICVVGSNVLNVHNHAMSTVLIKRPGMPMLVP